jgi:hypothetical protein
MKLLDVVVDDQRRYGIITSLCRMTSQLRQTVAARLCRLAHIRFSGTAAMIMRSFAMALIVKDYAHKELAEDDLQGIYDFIADAEIVAGPDELYTIVSELWPELLHKVKPPFSLMH